MALGKSVMPLAKSRLKEGARELIRECAKPRFNPGGVEEDVFNAMTFRRSQAEIEAECKRYSLELVRAYKNALAKVSKHAADESSSWMTFSAEGKSANPRIGKYSAVFKRYYSIRLDSGAPQENAACAVAFVRVLPSIRQKLESIGHEVHFKVPTHLYGLLYQTDSLVLHYFNPEAGEEAARIIGCELAKAGVRLEKREFRSDKGFDLIKGRRAWSHSRCVAKVIANHLRQYWRAVAGLTQEQAADWLGKAIVGVSRWNPE
ncbi:TPA: hypothetical protein HA318_03285 [Candidatus Micrarchaeota archaeon]|nr:MAG: hypothetical protein AUJ65_05590 [Candidatus Micrarchaeota archaeon CG1_02_51_15]HII38999.1 hypothetical protein [Candidatus Micrarchaeota archaeon]